jgi:phosphate-selective porin
MPKLSLTPRLVLAWGALVLGATVARGVSAQGLFFAEERKDGRIYVFNVKDNWERFKASGETGVGITRLGAGPEGETVYADNETALELFFFKHGIAESVPRPPAPVQRLEWRDGKTRLTMGSAAYLEMSSRIQPRFTAELPDDAVQLSGTAARGDAKGSFRIRRAKFKLEGWFYRPWLEFETQLNWPDVTGAPASRFLEDANIDWDVTRGKKAFRVRFGQFKAPYGRQQITSSGSQQFVDRAETDARYSPGRETGVAVWGTLGGNKLEYRAMVSNGNGRSQAVNDNAKYLWTARVTWQPNNATRMNQWASGALLTEGDLDSVDRPLFALSANILHNSLHGVTTGNDLRNTQWSGDGIFKYRGFSAVAEYHARRSTPETGARFDDRGFLAQASYAFKTPRLGPASFVEIAGRYVEIDPSDLRSGDRIKETGAALSYYYNRHNLKVQADFRQLENQATRVKNKELRLQTQFIF